MSKALPLFAVQPTGTLAANAPLMLYTRFSEMAHFAAYIHDPARVTELHSMRIASKRLRYTLEIFAPAFDFRRSEYAALLDEVKTSQEKIGEIHDCDIRILQIQEYLNQNIVKKPEIRAGLQKLIELESANRVSLYENFIGHWDALSVNRTFEQNFINVIFSARVGDERNKTLVTRGKSNAKLTTVEQG